MHHYIDITDPKYAVIGSAVRLENGGPDNNPHFVLKYVRTIHIGSELWATVSQPVFSTEFITDVPLKNLKIAKYRIRSLDAHGRVLHNVKTEPGMWGPFELRVVDVGDGGDGILIIKGGGVGAMVGPSRTLINDWWAVAKDGDVIQYADGTKVGVVSIL